MAVIFISSDSVSARETLAERLATMLGSERLCREDIVREAEREGIPVAKLESAVTKSAIVSERLARQRELFLVFATHALCSRAVAGNLIYDGRTGHLLLQGIPHILKARLVVDRETRIEEAMERSGLDREKASEHIRSADEGVRKWARHFYDADIDDTAHYDVIINLAGISISNACETLRRMAEQPDFRLDAVSIEMLKNRCLEMNVRRRLATDSRTARADLRARAEDGLVTVTYQPSQRQVVEMIPKALEGLEGCKELTCTMADDNILWVQERFDPESDAFHQLNNIAQRWGAAIELARFTAVRGEEGASEEAHARVVPHPDEPRRIHSGREMTSTGNIENSQDAAQHAASVEDDGGLAATIQALVETGRFGGAWTIEGSTGAIVSAIRRDVNYGLIAIGDCFLSKPPETRVRMLRELGGHLTERAGVPVVTTDELRKKYLVGPRQLLKMALCAFATAVLYFLVFHFQEPILSFLGASGQTKLKLMRVGAILLFVPLIAHLYSTVTSVLLKLLRFE